MTRAETQMVVDGLVVAVGDQVANVVIGRPETLDPINNEMWPAIPPLVASLDADPRSA